MIIIPYYYFSLSTVCKKKSLFDNKQAEIQELTYIIKQDITSLNGQIAQLQQLARQQRGSSGKHQQSHSNSVVLSLQVPTCVLLPFDEQLILLIPLLMCI